MPPGKKWDEQDAAFFGESATSDSSKKLSTDEELAKKLQEQYLDEKKASEETDRDLAKRIQQQDSQSSDTNGGSSSNRGFLGQAGSRLMTFTRRKKQEDEDAALARAIHEEEEQGRAHSGGQSLSPNPSSSTPSSTNRTPNHTGDRSGGRSLIPRCAICHGMVIVPISALGNVYHPECFKCIGCHTTIRENERFAYTQDDDGKKHPLHRQCYAELYGLKCTVCSAAMQNDANGRVSYMKHPFFEGEYMCPKHSQEARRCTGCFRFEPIAAPFADLNDENRCVCDACLRSVIVDSDDAKPLWAKVMQFLENNLKLPIWPGMKDIPILIVGHNALNDQMMNSTGRHGGSSQIMTRGLCLSEHQRGVNFMLPHMRFDRKRSSFLPSVTATAAATSSNSKSDNNGYTYFQIPDASTSNPNSNVTAILCLSGLPADLTASILAHEATHAWIKLNPHFHVSKPIPPQVEEGCCQLIAMLFLTDGLGCASARESNGSGNGDGNGPSDQKLRQYFKFSIETASDDTYGEGYRKAARAYAEIGIEALMSHVVNYQEFPTV
jgi:hypothetical protein